MYIVKGNFCDLHYTVFPDEASKWQKINNTWYYFGADGYLLTNCYVGDYWVNSRGICE
ncbi:MAG: hypothetical protein K5865_04400 [Eubacterium sp.]|nr:hypothetical protein [Eubacterium sp.]